MQNSKIRVSLDEFVSQLDDEAGEELVWTGASQASLLQGVEVGSYEFIENYESFAKALLYSSSYKFFLSIVALTATDNLIKRGLVSFPYNWNEDQCKNLIIEIANTQYASLSYILVLTKAVEGNFLIGNENYENIQNKSLIFEFNTA